MKAGESRGDGREASAPPIQVHTPALVPPSKCTRQLLAPQSKCIRQLVPAARTPHPSEHAAAQFWTAGVVRAAKLGGGPRTGGRSSGARCRARAVGAAKYAKYGNTRSHFNVPMPATRLRGAGRRKALQIGFGLCGGGGRTGPPLCGGDATSDPERGRATMLPCRKIFGRTTARTATDGAEDGGYDLKPVASIARGSWSGARDGG